MKLIFKNFTSYDDLEKGVLPEDAVCFEEGDTIEEVLKAAMWYHYPLIGLVLTIIFLKWFVFKSLGLSLLGFVIGSILSLPFLMVHELIHALLLPKNEPIYIYQALKKGVLFVLSTEAMSKGRFIVMSLMPSLVLGVLPLISWLFLEKGLVSSTVFFFSLPMLFGGIGDLYNVSNTLKQVPKGAYVKLSGIHSYWFFKKG